MLLFQVLDLIKEVCEDPPDASCTGLDEDELELSDLSGYHSDSESCVMTSGNSPFISKEARYNFLSRSGEESAAITFATRPATLRCQRQMSCTVTLFTYSKKEVLSKQHRFHLKLKQRPQQEQQEDKVVVSKWKLVSFCTSLVNTDDRISRRN